MIDNKQALKNMASLLEIAKKNKSRILAGAGAVIATVSIGHEAAKIKNEEALPFEEKKAIESIDPDYKAPKITLVGGKDSEKLIISEGESLEYKNEQDEEKLKGDSIAVETEEKLHVHEYGEWQFLSDEEEVKICSCGKTETRSHKLSDLVKTYEVTSEGKHKVKTTVSCSTCDYTSTLEEVEDCVYVIESADDEFEYKTCVDCKSHNKVAHDYGVGMENINGTTTYVCKHKDCSYEVDLITDDKGTQEHIHNYDDAVITYEDITDKNHTIVCTQKCIDPKCEDPLKVTKRMVPHTFGKGVVKNGKIIYTCVSCGYEETKGYSQSMDKPSHSTGSENSNHTHNYGEMEITYKDITEEGHTILRTKKCEMCGSLEVSEAKVAHTFGVGVLNSDKTKVTYTCSCGYQKAESFIPEEHIHNYGEAVITYEDITEEGHITVSTKSCNNSGCDKPNIVTETFEEHTFDDGVINDTETKVIYTCNCGYQKEENYEHVHSEAPADLEYVFDSTNNDGTHKYKATYICSKCGEEVTVYKNEECDYKTTYESVGITNPSNIHNVINTCEVCGHETKTTGSCTKVGEMKYIKIYDNIYQYYECADCHGYVDRNYHTEHTFGDWEIDDKRHIRYCGCVEGREEGEHVYKNGVCEVCGYVLDHEHAPDGMDLMDLVLSPYYYQLVSKSNFTNPNPNPNEYCFRYDLICSTCGVHYSIHYDHNYVNGVCKRSDCKVLDPNYALDTIEEVETNDEALKLIKTLDNENR